MLTMTGTLNASVTPTTPDYSFLGLNSALRIIAGGAATHRDAEGQRCPVTFTNTTPRHFRFALNRRRYGNDLVVRRSD